MASPTEHELVNDDLATDDPVARAVALPSKRRWLNRIAFGLLIILLALVVYGWTMRDEIARDLIGEQLTELGLPATYTIEDISPERQILTDVVVGDPANPDLTIERVEIALAYGFGVPEIGKINLIKPRLYGSYRNGRLSFGSLDPVLFAESDEPAGLPQWDIALADGRGLIESEFGSVGVKLEGEGQLDNGFTGIIAAIAPQVEVSGCSANRATIFGEVSTNSGRISVEGPVRLANLRCRDAGVELSNFGFDASAEIDEDFSGGTLEGSMATGAIRAGVARLAGVSGPIRTSFSGGKLASDFELTANGLESGQISAASLRLDGRLRTSEDLETTDLEADIEGRNVSLARSATAQLASLSEASAGTLLQPLLVKLSGALDRELRGANVSASLIGRMAGTSRSLIIPEGSIRSDNGAQLLSLSRLQYAQNGGGTPKVSGNFRFGGRDLPALVGRMEGTGDGQSVFRMRMDAYKAADSSVAIPEMLVSQAANGSVLFAGDVEASGPLPGGAARGLRMPVNGSWSAEEGLSAWRSCTQVQFDSLKFANLELASRDVTLCPARGGAILRQSDAGLRIAAGTSALSLSGNLAGTPISLTSGPVGLAYPGVATAEALNVSLGPEGEASRFVVSNVLAKLGEGISGRFEGADVSLFAVPLDLEQSSGDWVYTDGLLSVSDGQFTLVDRAEIARFEPLIARQASLTLEDSMIRASALLRAPASDREISTVVMRHDLGSGTGSADLTVDRLVFDDSLQPEDLSYLAADVAVNVRGAVEGSGRIDWTADNVTSSGKFSSESLDMAALFGPVRGASGTVEFVDLLSLTTAPNQRIKVASVNPGIEALNGEIGFSLRDGQYLDVTGGKWPFMGGTLTLRPVDLNLNAAEKRRYVLVVEALDSALFIENLELGNLAARGIFDGELPIVFDELGFGRIEGGLLQSRSGGNVSYVGELTYKDLSPIANYAFDTLKSLDYTSMRVEIEGSLTGDIVTKLAFDGVRQGKGTKQNIITRQIAKIPVRFNVNIKAPFYNLVGVLKSIYDPVTVKDPRDLGLLADDGIRFVPPTPRTPLPSNPEIPPAIAAPVRPDESAIQTSDSEELP